MQKSTIFFCKKYTLVYVIDRKKKKFLPLPFAPETSFFSAFLHSFNSGSKNSSLVGEAIHDVTTGTNVGISVDGTIKSLCDPGLF